MTNIPFSDLLKPLTYWSETEGVPEILRQLAKDLRLRVATRSAAINLRKRKEGGRSGKLGRNYGLSLTHGYL